MKKALSLVLVLALVMSMTSAFALNYSGNLGNESTFETMAEVQANAPEAMKQYSARGAYGIHPAMVGYPGETTYVYRSANYYGRNAAVRLNTNIAVFVDKAFETKDDALAYLKDLGLVDIIEEAIGSIILVTPSNGSAFTSTDQKYYYALQTAIFSQGAAFTTDAGRFTAVDPVYYGGYSFYYIIGIDGGATFINNYVASVLDYVSRTAGMLLINGKMDPVRKVADLVPVYLVNAPQSVVDKYETVNSCDALRVEGDKSISYCQQFPLRKVVTVETEEIDLAALVNDAFYSLFSTAQRAQCLYQGLNSASTEYQGYTDDSAPYSLCARDYMYEIEPGVSKTVDGIYMFTHNEERFSDIQNSKGEYLQTWYEYFPEEVLNGDVPDGTVPLVLANHGGGDDPRQFVDGQGLLDLCGRERFIMVAPYHQSMGYGSNREEVNTSSILQEAIPALVRYMIETYPAIDASRVYVTGYSMGAGATMRTIHGDASLFAAAAPMAVGRVVVTEGDYESQFDEIDLPFMMTCSEYDLDYLYVFNPDSTTFGPAYYTMLDKWLTYNDIDVESKIGNLDFDKYPITGFAGDAYRFQTLNDEYGNHTWYFNNDDGIPMVAVSYTESLLHALYCPYADLFWDFVSHYSRNPETLEISYNPYVR